MQISMMDGIEILIVSMAVVFLVLTILMCFLKLIARFFTKNEPVKQPLPQKVPVQVDKTLFEQDEDAQAAALIALIEANHNQQDRHYEIAEIKQIN